MTDRFLSLFQFSGAALLLTIYVAVFALMVAWEFAAPRRAPKDKAARWCINSALLISNTAIVRIALPVLPVTLAVLCRAKGWGILNAMPMPLWIRIPAGIILLDLSLYLQHLLFHALPLLWRIHQVHHADDGIDVTSSFRYHPFEPLVGTALVLASVSIIGPDPIAVAAFEAALGVTAMFSHGNVRIPSGLDAVLRWMMLTPDMHRVHHSADEWESRRNFSSIFSWWDRIFGTYRAAPAAGHEAMVIGLASPVRVGRPSLWGLIILPFNNNNLNNNNVGGYREPLSAEIVSRQDRAKKKKQ